MSMEFSAGESHEEVSELRSEHNHRGVDEEIENRIEQSSFFNICGHNHDDDTPLSKSEPFKVTARDQ